MSNITFHQEYFHWNEIDFFKEVNIDCTHRLFYLPTGVKGMIANKIAPPAHFKQKREWSSYHVEWIYGAVDKGVKVFLGAVVVYLIIKSPAQMLSRVISSEIVITSLALRIFLIPIDFLTAGCFVWRYAALVKVLTEGVCKVSLIWYSKLYYEMSGKNQLNNLKENFQALQIFHKKLAESIEESFKADKRISTFESHFDNYFSQVNQSIRDLKLFYDNSSFKHIVNELEESANRIFQNEFPFPSMDCDIKQRYKLRIGRRPVILNKFIDITKRFHSEVLDNQLKRIEHHKNALDDFYCKRSWLFRPWHCLRFDSYIPF